jgi:hypothetical protein
MQLSDSIVYHSFTASSVVTVKVLNEASWERSEGAVEGFLLAETDPDAVQFFEGKVPRNFPGQGPSLDSFLKRNT